MNISKQDLARAASIGVITPDQVEPLWRALEGHHPTRARFDLPHVAYYVGALIVISAMGWFMTRAWEIFGGGGLFLIAAAYTCLFVLAGRTLWTRDGFLIPGGLLFTTAVCMTPLAVYALERYFDLWPQGDPGNYQGYHIWVKGSWFLMEVGTILAGLLALRFIKFPFLTAPIAFTLWYMSMDLTPLLFGKTDWAWAERLWVSFWFGLAMLIASYIVDRRTKKDYAFWGYLFGLFAFWGGLSFMESNDELGKLFYAMINVGLMLLSVLLDRRAFIVFGSLGVFGYAGHLAHEVFTDSLLFPFALALLGIAVIYLGVQYQRHQASIEAAILACIPKNLLRQLPRARRSG